MARSYKRKSQIVSVSSRNLRSETGVQNSRLGLDFGLVASAFRGHLTIRIALIELPVVLLLFLTFLTRELLHIHETYLHPYMKALIFTPERQEWEETYPRMECEISDLTTLKPDPLFLHPDETFVDATEKAFLHGAVVFPHIMLSETALRLRKYIQRRNRELRESDHISVIVNENRISFTLSATEHPSVTKALKEIGSNGRFIDTLEALLGPDPSLMELQVITVAEGAEPQYFHADTPLHLSATMNRHTFSQLFTLLIPLQDTTPEMGPTAVCPGSHRCYFTSSCYGFGTDLDDNTTEQVGFQVVDPSTGTWEAGSGLLYNSNTIHRGTSHVKGPSRVALILTFAGRPDNANKPSQYSRFPPLDSVYAIRWHQMGHSLSDLADPYNRMSFSFLRWTGLTYPAKLSWSSSRFDLFRAANPGQYRFRIEDLKEQKLQRKGLMGTLSAILMLEVKAPPKHGPYNDVEYHLIRLLVRLSTVCLTLFVGGLAMYMSLVAVIDTPRILGTFSRLLVASLALYTLTKLMRAQVDQSVWASEIASGSIASHPPHSIQDPSLSQHYSMNLPTPRVNDVLVDNASFKGDAYDHFLDFSPGNLVWRSAAREQSKFFLLYDGLPTCFRDAVVKHVISLTKRQERPRRFFEKNSYEDYVEMKNTSVIRRTKDLIVDEVLHFRKRLGNMTDNAHCTNGGSMTLCKLRSKVIRDIFYRSRDSASHQSAAMPRNHALLLRSSLSQVPALEMKRCFGKSEHTPSRWEVGDLVQVQINRSGLYQSRKWVNAEITSIRGSGSYDVKTFSIDVEQSFGLDKARIRSPQQQEPDIRTLAAVWFKTRSGHASRISCFTAGHDSTMRDLCDLSSLALDTYTPEMARSYTIPSNVIELKITFSFTEIGPRSGNVYVRLNDVDLHMGLFDPTKKDYYDPGYFSDVFADVDPVDDTTNTITLLIPGAWILETNELVFGARVAGGISVHISNNILVSATTTMGREHPVYQWKHWRPPRN